VIIALQKQIHLPVQNHAMKTLLEIMRLRHTLKSFISDHGWEMINEFEEVTEQM
jgi:hypothetical protein